MSKVSLIAVALLASATLAGAQPKSDEKTAPAHGTEKPAAAPAAKGGGGGGGMPQMPPQEVTVVTVQPASIPVSFEFVGTTQASSVVEVRSRVSGFIEKRLFEEGAMVKEGDLLYTIDPRSFQADVDVAKAAIEQAKARLELAKRDLKRISELKGSGAAPQSDVDNAQAAFDEGRASLQLAQANLDKANLELGYTQVTAPLSGIIGLTLKEPGSYVDDGTNGLLTKITKISPIYVGMSISERDYLNWKQRAANGDIVLVGWEEQKFQIVLQNGTVFPEFGTLNYEDPQFQNETGTYRLRAEFANEKRLLKPGQFVKVRILGWVQPNTLAVPQQAIMQNSTGASVYVVDDSSVPHMAPVTLGDWNGSNWTIKSGLKAGDKVVVEGTSKLQMRPPGSAVAEVPYQASTPVAGQSAAVPGSKAGADQEHAGK